MKIILHPLGETKRTG